MFGRELCRLRAAKGMSLRKLAHDAGLSHSFICDLEKGRSAPSLLTIQRLGAGLGLAPAEVAALAEVAVVGAHDRPSTPPPA